MLWQETGLDKYIQNICFPCESTHDKDKYSKNDTGAQINHLKETAQGCKDHNRQISDRYSISHLTLSWKENKPNPQNVKLLPHAITQMLNRR